MGAWSLITCMHAHRHAHTFTCMCTCNPLRACMHVCMNACMYVCVCVCVCVRVPERERESSDTWIVIIVLNDVCWTVWLYVDWLGMNVWAVVRKILFICEQVQLVVTYQSNWWEMSCCTGEEGHERTPWTNGLLTQNPPFGLHWRPMWGLLVQ